MFLSLRAIIEKTFNRPSEDIALDMIYRSTGYKGIRENCTFGLPDALDQRPEIHDDGNTYCPVIVDEVTDDRFYTDFIKKNGFVYRRLIMSEFLQPTNDLPIIPTTFPFKAHDVLDQINRILNTQLTTKDIENIEYIDLRAEFIIIKAHKHSLAWIGGIDILVDLRGFIGNLLIPNFVLNGFVKRPSNMIGVPYYAGGSQDRLLSLINVQNGTNLVVGTDFSFGPLSVVNAEGRNTRLKVFPLDTTAFPEDEYILYTRLSLEVLNEIPQDEFTRVSIPSLPFSIHDILPQINAALRLDLTLFEVVNDTFTELRTHYPLTIRGNNSLAWVESVYYFEVNAGMRLTADRNHHRVLADGTPRAYLV